MGPRRWANSTAACGDEFVHSPMEHKLPVSTFNLCLENNHCLRKMLLTPSKGLGTVLPIAPPQRGSSAAAPQPALQPPAPSSPWAQGPLWERVQRKRRAGEPKGTSAMFRCFKSALLLSAGPKTQNGALLHQVFIIK